MNPTLPNHPVDAVLLDLDGTLLDTHEDLVSALNVVLVNHGKASLTNTALRPFVSKGAMVMVCLAFKCPPASEEAKSLWQEMLDAYENDIARHTRFFPGMERVINGIAESGKLWGIVTNKPDHLTRLLLKTLDLPHQPGVVVCGDTLNVKKPHPAPLLLACDELDVPASRSVYIGDDQRDMTAGRSAGMSTIAAAYGYIVAEENPDEWGADIVIQHADELMGILGLE